MSIALPPEGNGEPDTGNTVQDQDGNAEGVIMTDEALYAIEVKEQDRWLPIANVARIMKTALPDNAKIAKDAKECMQECVSEFISFVTSEASEKCQQEKRKTVNGEDILFAMTSLGFENYSEALKIYLARYRYVSYNHRYQSNSSKHDAKAASGEQGLETVSEEVAGGAEDDADDDAEVAKVEGTSEADASFARAGFLAANGDDNTYNGSYAD